MHIGVALEIFKNRGERKMVGILTSVSTILLKPSFPTDRKTCPVLAARQASMATPTLPSVEFLKPVGMERAEVSSRWT